MKANRLVILAALLAPAVLIPATPGNARTACAIGDNGITYNRSGQGVQFTNLRALQGMNCASARYVLNRWIRVKYSKKTKARLPTKFYDGYVTWYCGKRSETKWRCNEYTSNTAFTFRAYLL